MIKFNVESVKFRVNEINNQVQDRVAGIIGQERYDTAVGKYEEVRDQVMDRGQQLRSEANVRIDELNASFDELRERGFSKIEDVRTVIESRYLRASAQVQEVLEDIRAKVSGKKEEKED